jgi:hypothetical protein
LETRVRGPGGKPAQKRHRDAREGYDDIKDWRAEMNPLQKHGVAELTKAIKATENKKKGITGDVEAIREKLKVIMAAVENPVPNRVIDDE